MHIHTYLAQEVKWGMTRDCPLACRNSASEVLVVALAIQSSKGSGTQIKLYQRIK